jgi:hypothetical protein
VILGCDPPLSPNPLLIEDWSMGSGALLDQYLNSKELRDYMYFAFMFLVCALLVILI